MAKTQNMKTDAKRDLTTTLRYYGLSDAEKAKLAEVEAAKDSEESPWEHSALRPGAKVVRCMRRPSIRDCVKQMPDCDVISCLERIDSYLQNPSSQELHLG